MNKARNLIDHEEEIFSRPARTWFQSKGDIKRKSGIVCSITFAVFCFVVVCLFVF